MALRNKFPVSFMDLNADCLFEIFSHLKLSDVVNFRLQCSVLNVIVLKYLIPISKLSIVYTEEENFAERPSLCSPSPKRIRIRPSTLSVSERSEIFGQSYDHSFKAKPFENFVDQTLKNCSQTHFRPKDFIVISGRQKHAKLLRFVEKYLPNIKKLALIIDPHPAEYPGLWVASELLKTCPKIETLFLERTEQNIFGQSTKLVFKVDELGRLLMSIAALPSLSELHFFGRRDSIINFYYFDTRDIVPNRDLALVMIGHFLSTMLQKLRIFSLNHFPYEHLQADYSPATPPYLIPVLGQNFGNILELGCVIDDCIFLTDFGTVFNNLHTLTLFGHPVSYRFEALNNFENCFNQLKVLKFGNMLELSDKVMLNLNVLPNLETLTAVLVRLNCSFKPNMRLVNNRSEYENINKSIKHIQVEQLETRSSDIVGSYSFTDFFQGLLAVTVKLPEVLVYERNCFNDIYILKLRNYWAW